MNYSILVSEISDDPSNRGYAGMSDAEVAVSLNTADRIIQRPVPIKQILRWSAAVDGIYRLREASSTGPKDKRRLADAALQLLNHPHIDELDVTDPEIAGMLEALVSFGVFTAAERDALIDRGKVTISRAEELGLGQVKVGYVQRARSE